MILTRRYLKLVTLITLFQIVLSLTARAFGSTQRPNLTLLGFTESCEDVPQPCWHGIVPGVSEWDVANEMIQRLGYEIAEEKFIPGNQSVVIYRSATSLTCRTVQIFRNRETYNQYRLIETVELRQCEDLYLADFADWFVDRQAIELHDNTTSLTMRSMEDGLTITFANALRPFTVVDTLVLNPLMSPQPTLAYKWRGFVPFWRYCQLEPDHSGC
jgi:hypothetical protein